MDLNFIPRSLQKQLLTTAYDWNHLMLNEVQSIWW